jgi:hypothetical protein
MLAATPGSAELDSFAKHFFRAAPRRESSELSLP